MTEGTEKPATGARRKVGWLIPPGLALLYVVVAGAGEIRAGSEPFLNADEPRHVMTSVFWHDVFVIRPLSDPYGFAQAYYGHFPAIAPLHFPPLQHVITGAAFLLLGPGVWVARAVPLAMMALLILAMWHLARRAWGLEHAAICVLLFAAAPLPQGFRAVCMLETPCMLWMTLSVLFLYAYVRHARTRHIWLSAAAATAAALTKQHAAALIPALAVGCIAGFRREHLRSPSTYIAPACGLLIAGGYYAASVLLLKGSWIDLGSLPKGDGIRLAAACFSGLGEVAVAAALAGLAVGLVRRRLGWLGWVALAWAAGVVGLEVFVVRYGIARYLVYCAMPVCLLAGRLGGVVARSRRAALRVGGSVVLAAGLALPLYRSLNRPARELRGYRAAALKANALSGHGRVVFSGKLDGPFILFRRLDDPLLKSTTFRTSKLFGGGNVLPHRWYVPYVSSVEQMRERFRSTGARFVVLEDRPEIDSREHRWFWDWVHGADFVDVCRIPVTYPDGSRRHLLIRQYQAPVHEGRRFREPMRLLQTGDIEFDPDASLLEWASRQ